MDRILLYQILMLSVERTVISLALYCSLTVWKTRNHNKNLEWDRIYIYIYKA